MVLRKPLEQREYENGRVPTKVVEEEHESETAECEEGFSFYRDILGSSPAAAGKSQRTSAGQVGVSEKQVNGGLEFNSPPEESSSKLAPRLGEEGGTMCAPYELEVMHVIVSLGGDEFKKVVVKQGERAEQVARLFAAENKISEKGEEALRNMLASELCKNANLQE